MRILLVSNGYPPTGHWGTEFYTHQLATGLRARGTHVEVLCPVRESAAPRYSLLRRVEKGVVVHELVNAGDRRKRFADSYENHEVEARFASVVAQIAPDVVHFTHLLWGLSVKLPEIARAQGVATVVTATDYGLLCHRGQLLDFEQRPCPAVCSAATCARCVREPGPFDADRPTLDVKRFGVRALAALGGFGAVVTARDIERRRATVARAMEAVDHWIAPTRVLAARLIRHGVPRERLTHTVYGLDERPFAAVARARAAHELRARRDTERVVRFGFMGQFAPHKGLDRLLDAVRVLIAREVGPFEVELYGPAREGRHRRYLASVLRDDLRTHVRAMGAFDPLRAPEILARLSALVVPSRWSENAPLSVLQARAAGVPCIGSDVPGIREVLQHELHGVLVPREGVHELADALASYVHGARTCVLPSSPVVRHVDHLARIEALYSDVCAARAVAEFALHARTTDASTQANTTRAVRAIPTSGTDPNLDDGAAPRAAFAT